MEKKNANNGIGFFGVIQIAFIVLKLCNVIKWNWFWVLSPTVIPLIIAVVAFVLIVIVKKLKV